MSQINSTELTRLASETAQIVQVYFDQYLRRFAEITRRARKRFEAKDWTGIRADTFERMDLYEHVLDEIAARLDRTHGNLVYEHSLWLAAKATYPLLFISRHDGDLAETFFNSVTRKVFYTIGLDRSIEFFRLTPHRRAQPPIASICTRHAGRRPTEQVVNELLASFAFEIPYEDRDRDAAFVAREIDLNLWPIIQYGEFDSIEMIKSPFFRNKVAYLVGRICLDRKRCIPLVLPLYNGEKGLYVDTALLSERDVSIVFSFAHSYFLVDCERHDALIYFVKGILPDKPLSDLYVSIGFYRHGKTEFYRNLHRFIHRSKEPFIIAPGREGSVMIVFTMSGYDYVFKVIKDYPCYLRSSDQTSKTFGRQEVKERYELVRHRDRVGRMVDTQEFENMRFRKWRFSAQLLSELTVAARETVSVEANYVVINHVYVQRRVTPLLMYLMQEKDPETIRKVVLDFGYFLKDLAATGIFPSDLFNIWNYGVTRRGRVVLFDYDDVWPLEKPNFRIKPAPRDEFEEMEAEGEWIVAMQDDYFMDEMERYSGMPDRLRAAFRAVHADLYTVEFWRDMQSRVKAGEVVDITPYDRSKRFRKQQAGAEKS